MPAWITGRSSKRGRRRRERKKKRRPKIEELRLRPHSNRIRGCAFFFTKIWLNPNIPDAAIELAGRTVYRELIGVLTDLFNTSLLQASVPTYL